MDDPGAGGLSADEALSLVGHETRLDILRTLLDAAAEADDPGARLDGSELRERAGADGPGGPDRFEHHLGRLVGPLLEREEGGYRLRCTGLLAVGAALADTDGDCECKAVSDLGLETWSEEGTAVGTPGDGG
jgi:hypothetical protein